MDKTRTIIIDGIEIQTSLTGVEIAGLVQRNKELEQQVKKQKKVIDKINLIIKGIAYGENEDYYIEKINKKNELLKEVSK